MKLRLDQNNFDACPQYNEWLDELYAEKSGQLDILGFKPRPCFVLFTLSPETYQASFDDFQRQREEELKELVFSDFPSPIAHYFYRFENGYENDLQRLLLLRDSWEAVIDVLHAITIAECRFLTLSLPEPIAFKDLLSDSVAQRLLNIERIVACAKGRRIHLEVEDIISMSTLQLMRELNQSRNAFSHSAAQSELQARTWIGECYEDVINVLDDLRGLANVRIGRHIGQIDATTLRCEIFRGHGFTKTINSISLTNDQVRESHRYLQNGQVLAFCPQRVIGLRPLVHYREDAHGHTTKLCMFRKTGGNAPNRRIEYEVVGESARRDEDRDMFKAEIDELRRLFGLQPD